MCFSVSLQVVKSLKVDLVKFCVFMLNLNLLMCVRICAQLFWRKNSLMASDKVQLQCFRCFVSQEQMNRG